MRQISEEVMSSPCYPQRVSDLYCKVVTEVLSDTCSGPGDILRASTRRHRESGNSRRSPMIADHHPLCYISSERIGN